MSENKTHLNGLRLSVLAAVVVMSCAMFTSMTVVAQEPGSDCPDCELSGQNFDNQNLAWVNFSGANLYRASFLRAELSNADLRDANLNGVNLTGANLTNAMLSGADLTGARLDLADTSGMITDAGTMTDETTTCPNGAAGPCDFSGEGN